MTTRRLVLCALPLFALAAGCGEGGGSSNQKDVDQLARAPAVVLPNAPAERGAAEGLPRRAAERAEGLKDAVAAMNQSPESASRVSAAVFDNNRRAEGGEPPGAVRAAGGGGVRTASFTAPARSNTLRTDSVPAPAAGTLPSVDLPAGQGSPGSRGGGPVLLAYEAFQKRMYDTVYPVFSRLAWRALPPKHGGMRHRPSRVTLHHTAGHRPEGTEAQTLAAVRNIQHYHMEGRASQGKDTWDDIGYHFLIDGLGRVVEGRQTDALGAHAGSANMNNVGVSMMGDYNKLVATATQKDSLKRLLVFLALKYRIDPRQPGFLMPHRHFNNTDCPGRNLVSYLDELRAEVQRQTSTDLAKLGQGGFVPLVAAHPSA